MCLFEFFCSSRLKFIGQLGGKDSFDMEFSIREAVPADAQEIHDMIKVKRLGYVNPILVGGGGICPPSRLFK